VISRQQTAHRFQPSAKKQKLPLEKLAISRRRLTETQKLCGCAIFSHKWLIVLSFPDFTVSQPGFLAASPPVVSD
jgi:hypothetical protein